MVMEQRDFVNPENADWWLVGNPVPDEIVRRREQIQTKLTGGAGEDWYRQENFLQQVWEAVQAHNLLTELDEAGTDENKRIAWLDKVLEALSEEPEAEAEQESASTEASTPEAPVAETPTAPAPEKKKPSIFAKKRDAEAETSESTSEEPTATTSTTAPTTAPAPESNETQAAGTEPVPAPPVQHPVAEQPSTEAEEPAPVPEPQITEAIKDKIEDLNKAAEDPQLEVSQSDVDKLLADPAAQAQLAKELDDLDANLEQEIEQLRQQMEAEESEGETAETGA